MSEYQRKLESQNRRLVEALDKWIGSYLEQLYGQGRLQDDGMWTHDFMSEGEELISLIGMDPRQGQYDPDLIFEGMERAVDWLVCEAVREGASDE